MNGRRTRGRKAASDAVLDAKGEGHGGCSQSRVDNRFITNTCISWLDREPAYLSTVFHRRPCHLKIPSSPLHIMNRRLFPEIQSEIFLYCARNDADDLLHPSKAPLVLTRVCRSWRAIALQSTPSLWTFLQIPRMDSYNCDSLCRALETWLSLSNCRPLTISVIAPAQPYVDRLLAIIGAHSHRWKDMVLQLPVMPPLDDAPPFLERLALTTYGDRGIESFVPAILSAKRLRHLAVRPDSWHEEFQSLFSSRILEVFSTHCWHRSPSWDMGRFADNARGSHLVALRLSFRELTVKNTDIGTRCILPRLESLNISIEDCDAIAVFIDALELPRLKCLELSAAPPLKKSKRIGPSLLLLLSYCTDTISKICLRSVRMPPAHLQAVLASANNIQSLTLTNMYHASLTLKHLALVFSPTGELTRGQNTNLSYLCVLPQWEDADKCRYYCRQLVNVVESRRRCGRVAKLKGLGICTQTWSEAEEKGLVDPLHRLTWRDEGLRVHEGGRMETGDEWFARMTDNA